MIDPISVPPPPISALNTHTHFLWKNAHKLLISQNSLGKGMKTSLCTLYFSLMFGFLHKEDYFLIQKSIHFLNEKESNQETLKNLEIRKTTAPFHMVRAILWHRQAHGTHLKPQCSYFFAFCFLQLNILTKILLCFNRWYSIIYKPLFYF